MTIRVQYSCYDCGLRNIELEIRNRTPEEGVESWMKYVTEICGADHDVRSPDCDPEELSDLKIPMSPGTKYIGGPVEQ